MNDYGDEKNLAQGALRNRDALNEYQKKLVADINLARQVIHRY